MQPSIELRKIYLSKKSLIIIFIFCLIYISESIEILLFHQGYPFYETFFLNSFSEGHIQFILIYWFLPIYILLIFSDKIIDEHNNGYHNIINAGFKNKYIKSKYIIGFLTGFCLIISLQTIDIIINVLINQFYSIEKQSINFNDDLFNYYRVLHPWATVYIYTINASLYAGMIGMLTVGLSLMPMKKVQVYSIVFIINFSLYLIPFVGANKILQPFGDTSFTEYISSFIIVFLFLSVINCIIYLKYKRQKDYI